MQVDNYCERLAPGLWGEPLNAFTNIAFLVAAVLLARRHAPPSVRVLPVLLALVGLASLSFHTMATEFTGWLDTGFIAVFVLYYVVGYAHWFHGVRWSLAWLAAPVFVGFAFAIGLLVRVGPAIYLPALLVMIVLTGLADGYRAWFAAAAVVFAVSLTLRTVDEPLCAQWPAGTHFLWHLLNAVVLYLVTAAAITRSARAASRS
ncbi:hypothetical protein FKR81_29710 [Lentzea tibetensis]|uniref:Ceramidase n=1 Tax=Lentzea tibetensis TaxID=2591470 RepID=A0A563EMI8_9PSEU|nr:hypothetical protein [Lentzea tibetensis]TWP48158.1 hypothetical protein FKR81_29710 [Lentzea tibetensis]